LISGFDGGFNITENDIDWVLKLRGPDLDVTEKSKRFYYSSFLIP